MAVCAGDVNEDGTVNEEDIGIVTEALGTAGGEVGYDPRADVNRDCVVDELDENLVADNMGCGQRAVTNRHQTKKGAEPCQSSEQRRNPRGYPDNRQL